MGDPIYSTPAPMPFEDCGWAYDHEWDLTAEIDGRLTYRCLLCGDEIVERE